MNKTCCNKEMISLGDLSQLPEMNIIENQTWVCGECGKVLVEQSYDYDDEELLNLLECYEEKFKDTKIYNQLKNGD